GIRKMRERRLAERKRERARAVLGERSRNLPHDLAGESDRDFRGRVAREARAYAELAAVPVLRPPPAPDRRGEQPRGRLRAPPGSPPFPNACKQAHRRFIRSAAPSDSPRAANAGTRFRRS